jgi:hypothetical protein
MSRLMVSETMYGSLRCDMIDEKETYEILTGCAALVNLVIGCCLRVGYSVESTRKEKRDALALVQQRV